MAVIAGPAARIQRLDRAQWSRAASRFADFNYRQAWDFARHAAERVGAENEAVAVAVGDDVVALAQVRVKRVPIVGGLAYVNGGPLTRESGFDARRLAAAAAALRDEYVLRRGLILRVAPPVGGAQWNDEAARALETVGFGRSRGAAGYRTMLVATDRPIAEVRRRLHQKWRNCLNAAERQRLDVRAGDDAASLDEFVALFDEFAARKRFAPGLPPEFYVRVQRDAPDGERFVVHFAEREGRVVAGHVASVLGDTTTYLLGATSPEALTCKAAYLLQWRAVETANARGRRWYDLGGVDPAANPGVHHFKSGLGGEDVVAAGPFEACPRGASARVALAFESRWRAMRSSLAARA